jgi:hypothetical protein
MLFAISTVTAEPYSPPDNVADPLKGEERQSDPSLPFIYLEPDQVCYNSGEPLEVSIFVVNRSEKPLIVDWGGIVRSLALEPTGPGRVRPQPTRWQAPGPVKLGPVRVTQLSLDLRQVFAVAGPAVCRLSYARPLQDGRVHIAPVVRFLVEDYAAIDRLTLNGWPNDERRRAQMAKLLKGNPLFSDGGVAKTYGDDVGLWDGRPEMHTIRWQAGQQEAEESWDDAFKTLAENKPTDEERVLETLIDRLLYVSDNFSSPPVQGSFLGFINAVRDSSAGVRSRLHLKLAQCRDPELALGSLSRLSTAQSVEAIDPLITIADGRNAELASRALTLMGNYDFHPRLNQFLRRKTSDPNPLIALQAAIVTCYCGDASGYPIVLRCADHPQAKVRLEAVAQLVDLKVGGRDTARSRDLLLRRLTAEPDPEVLERVVESLQSYPTRAVRDAVEPFARHTHERVRARAKLVLNILDRDLGRQPK